MIVIEEQFLLKDEYFLDEYDCKERKLLIKEFEKLPEEFFANLRHFQPQIGCLNQCSICSKNSSTKMEFWTEKRQRNIIFAMLYTTKKYRDSLPMIVWDREQHRNGVIFSYLDNDIGNYFYLNSFIKLCYNELGVQTRISTVGYSRYNKQLNDMHKSINNELLDALGGIRISFTPYAIGWCSHEEKRYNREEYINDIANMLKIYKPYYEYKGSGRRRMCIELRYAPLIKICDVLDTDISNHKVILAGNYLYISKYKNIKLKISQISNAFDHSIQLSNPPAEFYEINISNSYFELDSLNEFIKDYTKNQFENCNKVDVYMIENYEGKYYSINPCITEEGNKGINIYPKTNRRIKTGYIITERFFLNALFKYKGEKGLGRRDKFSDATWQDVENVLDICRISSQKYYDMRKIEKYKYIQQEILPMITSYYKMLKIAEYKPEVFFDPDFTIDTGIICNMGRAITEFNGITSCENEPLTPVHERNYGKKLSNMTVEGVTWRLSCYYGDKLLVEKLNLSNTSGEGGQVIYSKKIALLKGDNEGLTYKDIDNSYLIPGQRKII